MKQSNRDVSIPIYSTHIPSLDLLIALFLLAMLGSLLFLLGAYNSGENAEKGERSKSNVAMILIGVAMIITPFIIAFNLTHTPANEHQADYLMFDGAREQGWDVRWQDVEKAMKVKYGITFSRPIEHGSTYLDSKGNTYDGCNPTFTKPVDGHVTIKDITCTKREKITPPESK